MFERLRGFYSWGSGHEGLVLQFREEEEEVWFWCNQNVIKTLEPEEECSILYIESTINMTAFLPCSSCPPSFSGSILSPFLSRTAFNHVQYSRRSELLCLFLPIKCRILQINKPAHCLLFTTLLSIHPAPLLLRLPIASLHPFWLLCSHHPPHLPPPLHPHKDVVQPLACA